MKQPSVFFSLILFVILVQSCANIFPGHIASNTNSSLKRPASLALPSGITLFSENLISSINIPAPSGSRFMFYDPPGNGLFGGITVDRAGNLFIADVNNHCIRKISAAGEVSTFAGSLTGLFGATDAKGTNARFYYPQGITIDSAGILYVADTGNSSVRKITPDGDVTTIAGNNGYGGADNVNGLLAQFDGINGIVAGPNDTLYVADYWNLKIRKLAKTSPTTWSVESIPIPSFQPDDLTIDSQGVIYATDEPNRRVFKITQTGPLTWNVDIYFAGYGMDGYLDNAINAQNAKFGIMQGITIGIDDNIYVADTYNHAIRKIYKDGSKVTTIAGSPPPTVLSGSTDDDNPFNARFFEPQRLISDSKGNLYVIDSNQTIRKIDSSGKVTTIAGTVGVAGRIDSLSTASNFLAQGSMAKDSSGNIYIADTFNHIISKVTPNGNVSTFSGQTGIAGSENSIDGNGNPAIPSFYYPQGVAIDSQDNIFIADTFNHTIRKITPAGVVTTFAGIPGSSGFKDGSGMNSLFSYPQNIVIDGADNIYVADTVNKAIRMISSAGLVTTIVGVPSPDVGFSDGNVASARFGYLNSIAVDSSSNLYVSDKTKGVIRKINRKIIGGVPSIQSVETVIGSENVNSFIFPFGTNLGTDDKGNLYAVDSPNNIIRKIASGGIMSIIAGTLGASGISFGDLPNTLSQPTNILVDSKTSSNNIFIYTIENNNLVKITLPAE